MPSSPGVGAAQAYLATVPMLGESSFQLRSPAGQEGKEVDVILWIAIVVGAILAGLFYMRRRGASARLIGDSRAEARR